MLSEDPDAHRAAETEMRAAMFAEARRRMEVMEGEGESPEDNVVTQLVEQCAEEVRLIVLAAEERWKRSAEDKASGEGAEESAQLDFEERERLWAEEQAFRRASWEQSEKDEASKREAERKQRLNDREAESLQREERAARTHRLRHDIYDKLHREKFERSEAASPKSFNFDIPDSPKGRSRFSSAPNTPTFEERYGKAGGSKFSDFEFTWDENQSADGAFSTMWEHLEDVSEIQPEDIPTPSEKTLRRMKLLPADQKRKLFKEMSKKCHPDKLLQRHGARMDSEQRAAIELKATEAFQALSGALTD